VGGFHVGDDQPTPERTRRCRRDSCNWMEKETTINEKKMIIEEKK